MRTLLLLLVLCCGTAVAQTEKPVRAPYFQGHHLPIAPQQNRLWTHGNDKLSSAAATLFKQGLADPRGLEYREIEIAVGNPWSGGGFPIKTHGWVFPPTQKERFAVAWNGLVYPAVKVGKLADVRKDWLSTSTRGSGAWSNLEEASVNYSSPSALKLVLLMRLGEKQVVSQLSKTLKLDAKADRYLELARDWTWFAFERAVCAHQRGDDRLALADSRMLTRVRSLIEAEAKRRGFKLEDDDSNSNFPNRKLPYLTFLKQLPTLLADCERRVRNGNKNKTQANDIAALINDLENVDARQWGQPGGVSLASDPRVQALVKRGNEVVEPLLKTLENDTRLTRSVSFHRDFFRHRNLISVSEAAYAALSDLLKVDFETYDPQGEPLSAKQMAAQIRTYWLKMGKLSPPERFYATLKDDKAGKDLWLQATANIVQPVDVETMGGWVKIPKREPGQKIEMKGEILRDNREPSVSQLIAKRSDDIAAIRTNSTLDHFLFNDAAQMALYLTEWDQAAALPQLKKLLARAWSIGTQPGDILAFNSNTVERFGATIAKMTLARVRCGDETAYDEYATWIQKVDLNGASFTYDELQKPLIQGRNHPSIAQALEYLFNNPKSVWSNVLAENNGSWLTDFWPTPLAMTPAFRKQALRALANKSPIGTMTFYPRKDWDSHMEAQITLQNLGMGYRGSNGDPDTPPAGQKRAFRVCDAYAYFYAKHQNGPHFQLFWPEKKRDEGVLACRKWLEESS